VVGAVLLVDVPPLRSTVIAYIRTVRQMSVVREPSGSTANLPVRPGRLIERSWLRWEWRVGFSTV
jgi:hypothetical protein